MAKVSVEFAGRVIDGEVLTSEEEALTLATVHQYLGGGNDFLGELFKENQQAILNAAMVAKDKFDAPIKGMMASDSEVGIQLIRPGHILRDTTATETPINTWDSESIQTGAFASGNDNWIGYGTNNATASRISQYLTLLLMGIQFTQGNSPVVHEMRFTIGNTIYPTTVLRHAWVADNRNRVRAVRFHPLLVEPRQSVLGEADSQAAGRQELVLLGLAFGTGRYLRLRSYAAADLP